MSDAELARWNAEAAKLRRDAEDVRYASVRDELLNIAKRYDRLQVRAAHKQAEAEVREERTYSQQQRA